MICDIDLLMGGRDLFVESGCCWWSIKFEEKIFSGMIETIDSIRYWSHLGVIWILMNFSLHWFEIIENKQNLSCHQAARGYQKFRNSKG